jgi:hypothetical protein
MKAIHKTRISFDISTRKHLGEKNGSLAQITFGGVSAMTPRY